MPLKPAHIAEFYRRLGARGESATSLAAALGLQQHTYVSRLVYGHGRRRDGVWWPKLKALLTQEEIDLIAPEERYAYPTLAAAIAALPEEGHCYDDETAEQAAARDERAREERVPQEIAGTAEKKASAEPLRSLRSPVQSECVAAFLHWRNRRTA